MGPRFSLLLFSFDASGVRRPQSRNPLEAVSLRTIFMAENGAQGVIWKLGAARLTGRPDTT
jgi:hypothetical protein